jgi:hypothetical protein
VSGISQSEITTASLGLPLAQPHAALMVVLALFTVTAVADRRIDVHAPCRQRSVRTANH